MTYSSQLIVGGAGGPRTVIQELALEIARGKVLGAEPFGAYGRHVTSGSVSNQLLWSDGVFKIPAAAGISIDVVSTSADDTAAGIGAQAIEIHYLDVSLNPQSIVVSLNGVTPVTNVVTGVRFIQSIHIHTMGTPYAGASGIIKAYQGAQIYAQISTGGLLDTRSARMVPAGKRAVIVGLVGSSVSGTAAASAEISIRATEIEGNNYADQGLFYPYGSVGLQDTSESFQLPIPEIFQEGTVIAMFGDVDKAAVLSGNYYGWLEDVA